MLAPVENPWGAATFALTVVSAISGCSSVFLKLRMTMQIMDALAELRKELALTYLRSDVYTGATKDIERRLNRLEGCRGPT